MEDNTFTLTIIASLTAVVVAIFGAISLIRSTLKDFKDELRSVDFKHVDQRFDELRRALRSANGAGDDTAFTLDDLLQWARERERAKRPQTGG